MKKINVGIVFTFLFFIIITINLVSQETIYLPSGEEIHLSTTQKNFKEALVSLEHKGLWIKAENYNFTTKTISNSSVLYTGLYYLTICFLFLLLFLSPFGVKWNPWYQMRTYISLIIVSCCVAFVASLPPEIGGGMLLGMIIGVIFAFTAVFSYFIPTGLTTLMISTISCVVGSQLGFIKCFYEIIFPLILTMAGFIALKFTYIYIKNSKRRTSLDL